MTILALCVLFSVNVFAQDENVITRMYAGYLTYTTYDENLNVANGTDWRIGGAIEYPTKVGLIKAYSVFGDGFSITSYALKMKGLQFGKIARPITFHRPWPPSAGSHFEPPSVGAIPGGSLGAEYFLGNQLADLRVAVHEAKDANSQSIPEYGISSQLYGSLRFSANGNSEISGIAATYNGEKLSFTTYMNSDSVFTNFMNYYVSEKVAVFSDFNHCPAGISKYEAGVTVDATGYVKSVPLDVLLGTGVVYHDPAVDPTLPEWTLNLYIFITKTHNRK